MIFADKNKTAVWLMRTLAVWVLTVACVSAGRSQAVEGTRFSIKLVPIDRSDETGKVEASSDKVIYKLSSEVSSCRSLFAGNEYRAFRATIQNDPGDRTKDSPILVIFKNPDEKGDKLAFNIVSEKALKPAAMPIQQQKKN
jgi:hypothetical protein